MATTTVATKKSVRFAESCPLSVIIVERDFTAEERDTLWYRPEFLKAQTRREVSLYRRTWTSPIASKSYCWRGLETKLKGNEAQKKRWWTFLESFLAFQRDLKALDADVSNLLMVYASKQSQPDRKKAHQVGLQDEADAFIAYNEDDASCSTDSNSTRSSSSGKLSFSRTLSLGGKKKKDKKNRQVGPGRSV
jgi:hypothetical protein